MDDCKRADYLILLNGGSVEKLRNITKAEAICKALAEVNDLDRAVTLVEVIGEIRLEARWVDAKEPKCP
jgi:hypothetical protein